MIIADGLYVSQKVIQTCKNYGWDYIIRYKEGSASSIAEEYRLLPEKERLDEGIEYQNQIPFKDQNVNLIYYTEKKVQANGKEKITEYAWITSIEITRKNARKIVQAWKKSLENRKSGI